MRGDDEQQLDVFSYVSPEQRIPQDHPLRPVRAMADEALRDLKPRFSKLYAKTGRPSIAPEKLLRALLLQVLYSVRSERMLMEQLNYNLLFRWFVGLNMDDSHLGCDRVQQESAAATGWRYCRSVLRGRAETSPSARSALATSTSPWMELYWKRGRGRRVFVVAMMTSSRLRRRAKKVARIQP